MFAVSRHRCHTMLLAASFRVGLLRPVPVDDCRVKCIQTILRSFCVALPIHGRNLLSGSSSISRRGKSTFDEHHHRIIADSDSEKYNSSSGSSSSSDSSGTSSDSSAPVELSSASLGARIAECAASWERRNASEAVAVSLKVCNSFVQRIVSRHPSLTMLSERHLVAAVRSRKEGGRTGAPPSSGGRSSPSSSSTTTTKAIEHAAVTLSDRLIEVARHGIDVPRLRMPDWIWQQQDWPTVRARLAVDTCPELRASLCAYDRRAFANTMYGRTGADLTTLFGELSTLMREIADVTDRYEMQLITQRYTFFLRTPLERLRRIGALMRDAGMPTEMIRKDLWVFRHNETMIRERLVRVCEVGLPVLKPWMLRCPEQRLDTHIKTWQIRQSVMQPHAATIDYLMTRLTGGDRELVEDMVRRHPPVVKINAPKLAYLIDFLLKQGYTCKQIWRSPRVMSSSAERIEERIRVYQKEFGDGLLPSLHVYGISQQNFDKLIERKKMACKKKEERSSETKTAQESTTS